MNRLKRFVVALVLAPVKLYQRFISPLLSPRCRYYPTCSNYFVEAVQVHGAVKGTLLGIGRLARCNPWTLGGVNHIPPRGAWRGPEWIPPDDWAGHDIEDSRASRRVTR